MDCISDHSERENLQKTINACMTQSIGLQNMKISSTILTRHETDMIRKRLNYSDSWSEENFHDDDSWTNTTMCTNFRNTAEKDFSC